MHREKADTSERDALIAADAAVAEARRSADIDRSAAERAALQLQATAGQLEQIGERASYRCWLARSIHGVCQGVVGLQCPVCCSCGLSQGVTVREHFTGVENHFGAYTLPCGMRRQSLDACCVRHEDCCWLSRWCHTTLQPAL